MRLLAEGGGGLAADAGLGPSAVVISEPLALLYSVSRHQNGHVSITCKAMYLVFPKLLRGIFSLKTNKKTPCSVLV